jgi:uncharacterized protein with HEPN domain
VIRQSRSRYVQDVGYLCPDNALRPCYAATRWLEIISEASRRLPSAFKERFPEIPWKQVAGSGNIYRHSYENVQERRIWATIHEALPALRAVVDGELDE